MLKALLMLGQRNMQQPSSPSFPPSRSCQLRYMVIQRTGKKAMGTPGIQLTIRYMLVKTWENHALMDNQLRSDSNMTGTPTKKA